MKDLREAIMRNPGPRIVVESQLDDGSWRSTEFSNENAATDFERQMARREVPTRRRDP